MRDIITAKLTKSQEIAELNAEIFYIKNLNIHRCVLVADVTGHDKTSPEALRSIVLKYHRASWFRGMGFGVILAVDCVNDVSAAFDAAIDVRNQSRGTWQWSILHSSIDRICVGYHTWTYGMTSGVFQELLRQFKVDGYRVSDHKAQMDRFMEFATKWTRHGRMIQQYQEIFPTEQ